MSLASLGALVACSSSSGSGTSTTADSGSPDVAPDVTVDAADSGVGNDSGSDSAPGLGDAGEESDACTYSACQSSIDPQTAIASWCAGANGGGDGGIATCGNYLRVSTSGVDTASSCTYDLGDGGLVESDWIVNTSSCIIGSTPCTNWVAYECSDGGAHDAAPGDSAAD